MQQFSIYPTEIIHSLIRNRYLLKKSIQRDVLGRYKGSFLGLLWSFFQPILMLIIYTFVFSVVFKAKWPGGSESKTEFALILFSGLMVFNLFAECINQAPSLILFNVNYVKKVVYPLEILPWITLGGALFNLMISAFVWVVFSIALSGPPPLTIILFPLVLLPLIFFIMGISYLLSSLGVFLRDIAQVMSILITALLFLSPIFYSPEHLPEAYQKILFINPLTLVIQNVRDVLLWGVLPNPTTLIMQYGGSLFIFFLGFAWFQKTRKGFADVI